MLAKNVITLLKQAAEVETLDSRITWKRRGELAGVPKETIRRLLERQGGTTLATLVDISEKFRMPVWQLLLADMDVDQEAELLAIFRELDDGGRAELLGYARGLRTKKRPFTVIPGRLGRRAP